MVKEWLLRAKELSSHSPKMLLLFRQLVARAGKPPPRSLQNGELYSFWVGNILPTSSRDRQLMLSCRSTRVRLFIAFILLKETIEQTKDSASTAKLHKQVGGVAEASSGSECE